MDQKICFSLHLPIAECNYQHQRYKNVAFHQAPGRKDPLFEGPNSQICLGLPESPGLDDTHMDTPPSPEAKPPGSRVAFSPTGVQNTRNKAECAPATPFPRTPYPSFFAPETAMSDMFTYGMVSPVSPAIDSAIGTQSPYANPVISGPTTPKSPVNGLPISPTTLEGPYTPLLEPFGLEACMTQILPNQDVNPGVWEPQYRRLCETTQAVHKVEIQMKSPRSSNVFRSSLLFPTSLRRDLSRIPGWPGKSGTCDEVFYDASSEVLEESDFQCYLPECGTKPIDIESEGRNSELPELASVHKLPRMPWTPSWKNRTEHAGYTMSIFGTLEQVLRARATILQQNPSAITETLRIRRELVINDGRTNQDLCANIDRIMMVTSTRVTILGAQPRVSKSDALSPVWQGMGLPFAEGLYDGCRPSREQLEQRDELVIEVTGPPHRVDKARRALLAVADAAAGLTVETLQVDPKFQYIVGGRKHHKLHRIMRNTGTNIYIPNPLETTSPPSLQGIPNVLGSPDVQRFVSPAYIIVSGAERDVAKAKSTVQAALGLTRIIAESITMEPWKADWLLLNRQNALTKIMYDNGTFVAFPYIGSFDSLLMVYGDSKSSIERTIRLVTILHSECQCASLQVCKNSQLGRPVKISDEELLKLSEVMTTIAEKAGVELLYNGREIELHGTVEEIQTSFALLASERLFSSPDPLSRFKILLPADCWEYVCGTNGGKVQRIERITESTIECQRAADGTMRVDIACWNPLLGLRAFALVCREIPAEISFNIPEGSHRRVIGPAGQHVQRITKAYQVYLKVSDAEECRLLGGYFENDDNVIVRTPRRNRANLPAVVEQVWDLVDYRERREVNQMVSVRFPARAHHLLERKASYIEELTRTTLSFPSRESGVEELLVAGSIQGIQKAVRRLREYATALSDPKIREDEIASVDDILSGIMSSVSGFSGPTKSGTAVATPSPVTAFPIVDLPKVAPHDGRSHHHESERRRAQTTLPGQHRGRGRGDGENAGDLVVNVPPRGRRSTKSSSRPRYAPREHTNNTGGTNATAPGPSNTPGTSHQRPVPTPLVLPQTVTGTRASAGRGSRGPSARDQYRQLSINTGVARRGGGPRR